MNRTFYYVMLLVLSGALSAIAQETDASSDAGLLSESEILAMEQRVATIRDPAARLFFQANIHRAKGELEQAHQTLAKLIVHHPHEKRWVARSELLSAKLYMQTGRLDEAEVTARHVEFLNEGTEAAESARLLLEHIEQAKETSEEPEQEE